MSKKILILFYLMIACTCFLSAQILTVKDQENKLPIEFVNIISEKSKDLLITNAEGQVDISALKNAEKIEIRLIGFKPLITNYTKLAEENFTIYLATDSFSLDQIVVSATRWSQSQNLVPHKIISITPKEISLQNPQTAADLLGISGEVYIQKSQLGGGSPIIRGFATNRLLLAVDGVRMNTAIFRSGNLQNVISIDPFTIESTEVLFGPGSIIYGSDAIGGVMSFQTKTPLLAQSENTRIRGNGSMRYSTANQEFTGHLDLDIGFKKWAFVSSISSSRFNDLRMGKYGPNEYLQPIYVERRNELDEIVENQNQLIQRPTGYSQLNWMQKVRFSPSSKWDFQYGFHYSETSSYARYDRLIRYRANGIPRSAEWNYGPQKWMMNLLTITHQKDNSNQMALRLAHQFFEESRIDRDFNDSEKRTRIERVNAYSMNLDFNTSFHSKHQLYYGIETVFNDINSIGFNQDVLTNEFANASARYPISDWASYAVYLTYQYKWNKKWVGQVGVRYNRFGLSGLFDTTFFPFPFDSFDIQNGALTGSIGLTYTATPTLKFNSNLSTGFRSPNIDDVGKVFDSEPGAVTVPNPNLRAEYAYNIDFGFTRHWGNFLKIEGVVYYTFLDDAMVRRNFTLNGQDSIVYDGELSQVQAIQNASQAYVLGFQVGVDIKFSKSLGFYTRFNYQKGEEELDNGERSPSRHIAPWFGATHFTFTKKNLLIDLYTLYNGEVSFERMSEEAKANAYLYARDGNNNPFSPGWITLNCKFLYQIDKRFSVSTGLENITDLRYRPYTSGISAPGRNFIISAKASF